MADLSTYTPIYIRTDGDDTTGDGSLGAPFATAQKGFETAYLGTGDFVLDLGEGSFGGVNLETANTTEWPSRIAVQGVSASASNLGGITGTGVPIAIIGNNTAGLGNVTLADLLSPVSVTDSTAGNFSLTGNCFGGMSVSGSTVGDITAQASDCFITISVSNSTAGNVTSISEGDLVLNGTFTVGEVSVAIIYVNGTLLGGVLNGIYYLADSNYSVRTTLNANGTGWWNEKFWISAVETTLPESGTGWWNNKYYVNGVETTLPESGTGWQGVDRIYYINGVATQLSQLASGRHDGYTYIRGRIITLPTDGRIRIRTDGSDTTGNGSEEFPFATAQIGFEAAYSSEENFILDVGEGNFGGVNLGALSTANNTPQWPARIAVQGVSISVSNLGGITYISSWHSPASTLVINGNNTVYLGNININGGEGYAETSGYNASSLTLVNCTAGNVSASGGTNYEWECSNAQGFCSAPAGSGGAVVLQGSTVDDIDIDGGYSVGYYSGSYLTGAAGSVNLNNSTAGNVSLSGGNDTQGARYYTYSWVADVYYINNEPSNPDPCDGATPQPGWNSGPCFSGYYINGQQTSLPQSGTGWWASTQKYYIGGAETPLDENGNGFIDGQEYRNGEPYSPPDPCAEVTAPYDGWGGACFPHYYISGQQTSLPQNGTGWWEATGIYYVSGTGTPLSQNGTGWWQEAQKYYIGGVETPLNQNGTGWWNDTYYLAGTPTNFTGWHNSTYYIDGVATPLDQNGNGTWNGRDYANGQLLPITTLYYTNADGTQLWKTLSSWTNKINQSGVQPTEIPWVNGPLTRFTNLKLAPYAQTPRLSGLLVGTNGTIIATCDNSIAEEIISNGLSILNPLIYPNN